MDFCNSFIPVFVKYDFTSGNHQPTMSNDWIECRLNVKPDAANAYRTVQISVYPKLYDEMLPHFTLDIESEKIRCGPVKSRSKANVYGILWPHKQKRCRIFIAFGDKTIHQNFSKYFRKLLKCFNLINNCEKECTDSAQHIKSSVCNEVNQVSRNGSSSSVRVMRVSDASGHFKDVLLRPKGEPNRLARPLAVISGLFKSNRESGVNQEENTENLPNFSSHVGKSNQRKLKRKTWNIFKSKRKNVRDECASFQHFQEPLNIERSSIGFGGAVIDSDMEWYDLNKAEMSLFEARMSIILNEFNNYNQTSGESDSGSICRCKLGRHFSSNILRSVPCQSNGVHDGTSAQHKCDGSGHSSSFTSTDSNGYVVMQPVLSKKHSGSATSIVHSIQSSHLGYNSDETSSHASSGFGSDSDENTPQKSIPLINSPPTSDFSDSIPLDKLNKCSRAPTSVTPTNMQKTSKKRSLRIKSRKLLGMLHVKPSPTTSPTQKQSQTESNVMDPTPPNKSPLECMKKVYKCTPFKLRLLKHADERDIMEPFQSLKI